MRKYYQCWIVLGFMVAGLFFTMEANGLPSVESRTGEPVMHRGSRQVEMQTFHSEPLYHEGNTQEYKHGNTHAQHDSMSSQDRVATMHLKQIEYLKKEVSDLRGVIETQENELKLLKKSQQDLYLDLDRRMSQMQAAGPGAMPAGPRPMPAAPTRVAPTAAPKATPAPSAAPKSPMVVPKTVTIPTKVAPPKPQITVPNATPDTKIMPQKNKPKYQKKDDEALLYQGAYNMVKNKRYEEAIQSFKEYLDAFPQGEHAANAHYWLGEVQMVQWQADKNNNTLLENASQEFSNLNTKFPNHTKTADAVLKMGIIELEKNNMDAARELFAQVKSRYPGTTAARIADNRLKDMP